MAEAEIGSEILAKRLIILIDRGVHVRNITRCDDEWMDIFVHAFQRGEKSFDPFLDRGRLAKKKKKKEQATNDPAAIFIFPTIVARG